MPKQTAVKKPRKPCIKSELLKDLRAKCKKCKATIRDYERDIRSLVGRKPTKAKILAALHAQTT